MDLAENCSRHSLVVHLCLMFKPKQLQIRVSNQRLQPNDSIGDGGSDVEHIHSMLNIPI